MHSKWRNQYNIWTTSKAENQVLQLFYENIDEILSTESYNFLLNVFKDTKTEKKSIRGLLPRETVVAHKTGYS